ncbi:hypothetical protein ACJX0J_028237, partial [Zea mays]
AGARAAFPYRYARLTNLSRTWTTIDESNTVDLSPLALVQHALTLQYCWLIVSPVVLERSSPRSVHLSAGSQASEARTTIMNCVFSCQGLSPMNVRYLYAAIFLVANLSAWFARENTVSYYLKQRLSGACQGDRGCLAAESVLVASHAFFLFFMAMFFSTVRTGKVNELRNSWHCGWWPVKIALFMVCSLISVLASYWWIQIY